MNETKVEQNKKVEPSETTKTSNRSAEALDRLFTFAAVIILFIIFSIVAPYFFTVRNVLDLALQTSTVTIMGIGELFVIITAGIDLSIGSVVALSGTVAVMVAIQGVPIWLSMVIGVLTGVVTGSLNGLMVIKLKLPPFIATLGMMMVARGVALTITNANAWPAPQGFGGLGNDTLFEAGRQFPGISYPVILMIVVALIFGFFLSKTRIGRYIYATGSNEEAARLSGIAYQPNQIHRLHHLWYAGRPGRRYPRLTDDHLPAQQRSWLRIECHCRSDHWRYELYGRHGHGVRNGDRILYHRNTHGRPHHGRRELLRAANRYRPGRHWFSNA